MAAFQDASHSTPEQAGTSSSSLQLQPTKDELTELYRKCSGSTVVPILFSIEEAPYNETFTQSLDHLPLPLQSFYGTCHKLLTEIRRIPRKSVAAFRENLRRNSRNVFGFSADRL